MVAGPARSVTRQGGEQPVDDRKPSDRIRPRLAAYALVGELLSEVADQSGGVAVRERCGDAADEHRVLSEAFDLEAETLDRLGVVA